ncbi:ZNF79 protein, partial [Leucopsar rothschildi]|nr:ZNF79 protein [Leucopsar rothschildi]
RPTLCQEGGWSFIQRSDLVVNEWLHSGEKPCKYLECGKSFSQIYHLVHHQNADTKENTHTGEQPYTCRECKKKFSDCSNLICHQNIH